MRRLAAIATVLLLVMAGGCGGDDTETADPTATLTAAEVLDQTRAAAKKTESFEVSITATVEGTPKGGGSPSALESLISQPLDVTVKGPARRPHSMSLDADIEAPALPVAVTLIQKGDGLYLDVLGQAFRLVTLKGAVAAIEPANMPLAMAEWMEAPDDAGRESIDGVRTVHLRGTLTRQSLSDLGGLVAVLGGRAATPGPGTAALDTGDIDLWVGTDDLLPRRAKFSLKASGDLEALANVSALSLDATLDFTDYGGPGEITAPTDARDLRLDDLSGLLGG
jgi:hypothetical protein